MRRSRFLSRLSLCFPVLLLLVVGAVCPTSPARAVDTPPPPGQTTTIRLEAGHIWIDGTLNGKPAHFILDTGAGGILVTPQAAKRCGIVADSHTAVVNGASDVEAQRAVVDSIGVGDAQLHKQEAFLIALPEQLAGCDGLLGAPFLARFLVTIDYIGDRCTIGGPPPTADKTWFPLRFEQNVPVMDGKVDNEDWSRFEIDSGSGAAVMLWSPYVKKRNLRDHFHPQITASTGRGIGGLTYGDMVRLPTLTLGDRKHPNESVRLTGVVTELSHQTEGGFYSKKSAGQIGADLLRHFTVTLDYAHRRIALIPNADFAKPFVYGRAGLNVDERGGRFFVVDVIPGSPAASADFKVDDEVTAIDGVSIATLTAVGIYHKFRQSVGTVVHVQRKRPADTGGASDIDIALTLRDLL